MNFLKPWTKNNKGIKAADQLKRQKEISNTYKSALENIKT